MNIGVLSEISPEQRVALLPEAVKVLTQNSNQVFIEKGAGRHAFASDESYIAAGAKVVSRDMLLEQAALLLAINLPSAEDIKKLKPGHAQPRLPAFFGLSSLQKYPRRRHAPPAPKRTPAG